MRVIVEFFGVPRRLTGVAEKAMEMTETSDLRDLLHSVKAEFSALCPSVISPDTAEVVSPYMLSIDGRIVPNDLGYRLRDGDRILILSSIVGG